MMKWNERTIAVCRGGETGGEIEEDNQVTGNTSRKSKWYIQILHSRPSLHYSD